MGKTKDKSSKTGLERKPWIPWNTGLLAMVIVSIVLAVWVGWQMVNAGNTIGKAVLWGLIFGVSIWLVFFGMNYFHSLFDGKNKK